MVLVGDEGRDVREKYANVNRQREREREKGECALSRARAPFSFLHPPSSLLWYVHVWWT